MKIIFDFQNKTRAKISKNFFIKAAKKVLRKRKLKNNVGLGLIIVGDRTIKNLNKKYRGINKITDVLSFSVSVDYRPLTLDYLGDIVICYPQAVRQAKEQKHSIKKELEILFKHGLRHLIQSVR